MVGYKVIWYYFWKVLQDSDIMYHSDLIPFWKLWRAVVCQNIWIILVIEYLHSNFWYKQSKNKFFSQEIKWTWITTAIKQFWQKLIIDLKSLKCFWSPSIRIVFQPQTAMKNTQMGSAFLIFQNYRVSPSQ